jgi:hypothetical protein
MPREAAGAASRRCASSPASPQGPVGLWVDRRKPRLVFLKIKNAVELRRIRRPLNETVFLFLGRPCCDGARSGHSLPVTQVHASRADPGHRFSLGNCYEICLPSFLAGACL